MKAARTRGRKGERPRTMTVDKLRYARHLMADRTRSIPDICRELDDMDRPDEVRGGGRECAGHRTARQSRGPAKPGLRRTG